MKSPNYYAIIPADVRYSSELSVKEKLLYGEITAYGGEVIPVNNLMEVFGVSEKTILGWVNHLAELGFINRNGE